MEHLTAMIKKISSILLTALFSFISAFPLSAEQLPLELETPEKPVYYQVKHGSWDTLYVYHKTAPGIYSLILERNSDENKFNAKYGVSGFEARIQYDVAFNGGKWQYKMSWDNGEGDFGIYEKAKNERLDEKPMEEFTFYESYYDNLMENMADVPGFIYKDSEGNTHFNLKDNTFAIRCRYIISWEDKEYRRHYLTGPWSETGTIGKDAEKFELPEFDGVLPPPVLTSMRFSDNSVDFFLENDPKITNLMLLSFFDNKDRLDSIDTEVRVNGGEWRSVSIANAGWFYDGRRSTNVEGLFDGDNLDLRVRYRYFFNDEEKYTEWASNVSGEAGPASDVEAVQEGKAEGGNAAAAAKTQAANKCLFGFALCCIMWHGFSICVWIIAALVLLTVLYALIKSVTRKNNV